ncbi:hypothetical protein Bca4012_051731 [Brassica carinata]|uniref:Uncharacterized protein n=1 Tax=Brassica carinata TaxID=52824 RepID=A0A8X7R7J3_BRACI|nr:hypothetical protein Bca52824_054277 [Brassica carinata]
MPGDNNEKPEETPPTVNLNPFQMQEREDEANDLFYGTSQPRNIATDRHTRRTKRETRANDSDDAYSSSGGSDVRSRRSYNPRKNR